MNEAHSKWSASKFETLELCHGKLAMEAGLIDRSNIYAAEGTVAHKVLDFALGGGDYKAMLGRLFVQDGFDIVVDQEMIDHVTTTLENIRAVSQGCLLLQSETKVTYATWLDVPEHEGWGTADCIVIMPDGHMQVHDFKYGRGIAVSAYDNTQMKLYALGAYEMFKDFIDIELVTLFIHQPRIQSEPESYATSVTDIAAWATNSAQRTVSAVERVGNLPRDMLIQHLTPGSKQCKFCKAKAQKVCPAARNAVFEPMTGKQVGAASPDEFDALPALADAFRDEHRGDFAWLEATFAKVDFIEDWCKSIRAEMEAQLLAGVDSMNFKLVEGRKGHRKFVDEQKVEALLKAWRIRQDVMYDYSLKSPTSFEKLAKSKVITEAHWTKLQPHITQKSGEIHVAPISDKRPAYQVSAVSDEFEPMPPDISDVVIE